MKIPPRRPPKSQIFVCTKQPPKISCKTFLRETYITYSCEFVYNPPFKIVVVCTEFSQLRQRNTRVLRNCQFPRNFEQLSPNFVKIFHISLVRLWVESLMKALINLFVPNAPFLYLLKTSENHKVSWCSQGVEKGCTENKWVKRLFYYPIHLTYFIHKVFYTPGVFYFRINPFKTEAVII